MGVVPGDTRHQGTTTIRETTAHAHSAGAHQVASRSSPIPTATNPAATSRESAPRNRPTGWCLTLEVAAEQDDGDEERRQREPEPREHDGAEIEKARRRSETSDHAGEDEQPPYRAGWATTREAHAGEECHEHDHHRCQQQDRHELRDLDGVEGPRVEVDPAPRHQRAGDPNCPSRPREGSKSLSDKGPSTLPCRVHPDLESRASLAGHAGWTV